MGLARRLPIKEKFGYLSSSKDRLNSLKSVHSASLCEQTRNDVIRVALFGRIVLIIKDKYNL